MKPDAGSLRSMKSANGEKREKVQKVGDVRNESGHVTLDSTDIKRLKKLTL